MDPNMKTASVMAQAQAIREAAAACGPPLSQLTTHPDRAIASAARELHRLSIALAGQALLIEVLFTEENARGGALSKTPPPPPAPERVSLWHHLKRLFSP